MKQETHPRRAVIVGATSGIGREVALLLSAQGWHIGAAGRRQAQLQTLRDQARGPVCTRPIDVRQDSAGEDLLSLIDELGGMDVYIHCSGIGHQNYALAPDIETDTLQTNGTGFVRLVGTAFRYLEQRSGGHIAVISSIAGTKGLGIAPAYSATKRLQNTYIDALEQLSHMRHSGVTFTDVRPGFVATGLLNDGKHYPMLMRPQAVARHMLHAIVRRRRVVVIDWRYRVLVALWRLIPRAVWKRLPIKN